MLKPLATGAVGCWSCWVNALSAVMARHAGIEPAWARLSPAAQILCPAAFSSQVPGRNKRGGRKERSALWKESYPRGKTETLAMGAVGPAEGGVSVGFLQAWHTLSVSVICFFTFFTFYNDGAAFGTTPWNLLFLVRASLDWHRMAAGDDRVCKLVAVRS